MRLLAGVVLVVLWSQVFVSDVALSDDGVFSSQTVVGMAVQQGCSSCGCFACGCSGFSGASVLVGSKLGIAAWPGSVAGGWPFAAGPAFLPVSQGDAAWLPGAGSGAVHYRYPHYSYRRPWAHPGPMVPNVTIIW